MRSALIVALAVVLGGDFVSQAQDRKFPYEAIVETEGEYVRSGPGPNFYPTDKLRKGDRVTVHRHDPGGWCMVAPPVGSFSWIRADHIQKSGDDRGVLKSNNVVVHVGSSLNPDEFTTIQGNLSKGDAVQILGEKTFPFEDGPKLMYKISPIRREWRWIQRKSIVAADAIHAEPFPQETAPRKKPSGPVAEQIDDRGSPDPFAQPISTSETVNGPVRESEPQPPRNGTSQPGSGAPPEGFRARLATIDEQFRATIQQDPSTWNLKEIERQYVQLDNEAGQPELSRTIAPRLDAVARYEKTHREYLDFLKLADETKQRDAQLAALQQQNESQLNALGGTTNTTSPRPLTSPITSPTPSQPGSGGATASTAPGGAASPGISPPANPKPFAGAGIIVPMAQTFAGGPQYALVAPGGKLLAYLIPSAGVDLRRSVNQSMGIVGDRGFRQEWGADAIVVRGLQPVQLRASR